MVLGTPRASRPACVDMPRCIPPSPRPRRARDPTPRGKCLEAKHRKRLGTSARHRARDGRRRQRVYEGIARKVTLNPYLCKCIVVFTVWSRRHCSILTYVFTVWSRTLSILTYVFTVWSRTLLNPHLCIHRLWSRTLSILTYVFTVWSRTLSILTGLRDGRRGVIHDGAVVGARPSGPSKPNAVSSASAAARSEPARRLAAERSAAPMALWIESAAREASVSPGTCGEKRRRRDEHLHARAHRVSRGTARGPTPGGGVARGIGKRLARYREGAHASPESVQGRCVGAPAARVQGEIASPNPRGVRGCQGEGAEGGAPW